MKKERMYVIGNQRVRTWNPYVGCSHACGYCYAPHIYKRFSKCAKCLAFEPHFHPERLQEKFEAGKTVFVCSMGDISFATISEWKLIFHTMRQYPKTTFMVQSKNPQLLTNFETRYEYPRNLVLGTTIETNRDTSMISKAPIPLLRYFAMRDLRHRKYITIEPIMDFDMDVIVRWINKITPEFVYIGYNSRDTKNKHLPEPSLKKTEQLITELSTNFEVRRKLIREPWWETNKW